MVSPNCRFGFQTVQTVQKMPLGTILNVIILILVNNRIYHNAIYHNLFITMQKMINMILKCPRKYPLPPQRLFSVRTFPLKALWMFRFTFILSGKSNDLLWCGYGYCLELHVDHDLIEVYVNLDVATI